MTMQYLVCNCTDLARADVELLFDNRPRSADALIRSLRHRSFSGPFGSTFRYSNQLVATGGYIAAQTDDRATGHLMRASLSATRRAVFRPTGMATTPSSFPGGRADPDHATPHGRLADDSFAPVPLAREQLIEPLAPAGTAWSNVRDLSRYLITQLHRGVAPDGRRVVSAANLEATWQPRVEISPGVHYGLGWRAGADRAGPLLSHNGGTTGFTSNLTLLPDADLGIAVLSNAGTGDLFVSAVWQRVVELVYGQPMQADASVVQRAAAAHQSALDRI